MNLDNAVKEKLIALAQEQAQKSIDGGNPPFGAVLADENGDIIGVAHNTQNSENDPTAHAEINLLRKVGKKFGTRYLPGYHLFANAEPCSMCMSGAIKARVTNFYFGAPHEPSMDPDLPAQDVASRAKNEVHLEGGILQEACEAQIRNGREVLEHEK
jgi:tRNA(Arg) A34 adenosine deaminase TadA